MAYQTALRNSISMVLSGEDVLPVSELRKLSVSMRFYEKHKIGTGIGATFPISQHTYWALYLNRKDSGRIFSPEEVRKAQVLLDILFFSVNANIHAHLVNLSGGNKYHVGFGVVWPGSGAYLGKDSNFTRLLNLQFQSIKESDG